MPGTGPAFEALRCPHCRTPLAVRGRAWRCDGGHAFDVARQGYVNLLPGPSPHDGDTAEMLDHRTRVHDAGVLDAVTTALVARAAAPPRRGRLVVEVGAGTAHHLVRVCRGADAGGVALDVSVAAARRAARQDPDRLLSVVADAWGDWPVRTGTADVVLSVFGPRNVAEAHRVLVPGGRWLVTTPGPGHLAELRPLGTLDVPPDADARLLDEVVDTFRVEEVTHVRDTVAVSADLVRSLVLMGPSAHHVAPDVLDRDLEGTGAPPSVTVDVTVTALTSRR